MNNRDLLKEAIADAKAVKETAIANAKAALEEAFTPMIREKLAKKLEEMDDMDEAELDEAKKDEKEMKENFDMDESYDMEEAKTMDEADDMEEGKELDEMDLDELLRELDDMKEDDSEPVMEGEDDLINNPKGPSAHGNVAEEEEMGMGEEEEEIDLENMTEDDLKSFIEDVIADMVAAGELEGEIEGEDEEGEEEGEEEEEVKLEELFGLGKGSREEKALADIAGFFNSSYGQKLPGADAIKGLDPKSPEFKTKASKLLQTGDVAFQLGNYAAKELKSSLRGSDLLAKYLVALGIDPKTKAGGLDTGFVTTENSKKELQEALKAINILKAELNEVNLLNSKLLYVNKIFRAKNLTESQKVKVLGAFDKATTVKEAKLVFETLSSEVKEKKSQVTESMIGGASKAAGIAPTKQPILEVNNQFARWQQLAGITK
jgi:hypothetical protein